MYNIEHESFINIHIKDRTFFKNFFSEILTLDSLMKKIISESSNFQKYGLIDSNKFKGDIFEIFAEIFFKINSGDNRIGICNYSPVSISEDYGVDGHGTGINGNPATVQIKFRSNKSDQLVQADIKQFPLKSHYDFQVKMEDSNNMIVFNTCSGLHYKTRDEMFNGKVREINYSHIKNFIDNNYCFWITLNQIIENTINTKFKKS